MIVKRDSFIAIALGVLYALYFMAYLGFFAMNPSYFTQKYNFFDVTFFMLLGIIVFIVLASAIEIIKGEEE